MLLASPPSMCAPFLTIPSGSNTIQSSTSATSYSLSYLKLLSKHTFDTSRSTSRTSVGESLGFGDHELNDVSLDWEEIQNEGDDELDESPWEGAVLYKRNPSVSHLEYCITLERLGLAKLSTDVSRSRASDMGLRIAKSETVYPLGTPVQISIDVTSKKERLCLDGIVKTVISLYCHRCGEPTAENVFSNFAVLLSEEPVDEANIIDMEAFFGESKPNSFSSTHRLEEDDDDEYNDWDEKLHFPSEEKQIDISKLVRDIVHVEMTIDSLCDSSCKGLCTNCGSNLNKGTCHCSEKKMRKNSNNPFRKLKTQLESLN